MQAANIIRTTLSGTGIYTVQGGESVGRLVVRVTLDTRLALSEQYIDFQYLTIPANTIMVLDPPNLLSTENLVFRLDDTGGSDGILEVLRC